MIRERIHVEAGAVSLAPESEWEGEASRSSPDFIRWVQSSLNRVIGLRLAVDGILRPVTRSASEASSSARGWLWMGSWARRPRRRWSPLARPGRRRRSRPRPPAADRPRTFQRSVSADVLPCSCASASTRTSPTAPVLNRRHGQIGRARGKAVRDRRIHRPQLGDSQPVNSLLVLGHASFESPDVYNYDLAMRRAEKVSEALAEQVEELEPGGGSRIDLQV